MLFLFIHGHEMTNLRDLEEKFQNRNQKYFYAIHQEIFIRSKDGSMIKTKSTFEF